MGNAPFSASAIPTAPDPGVLCREMSKEDILEMLEDFTFTARQGKIAGIDAVEVHGHTGYIIDQFLSPQWNKRTDEYGGSLENRMRFPIEIVAALRKGVGPDTPIIFRIGIDQIYPGGRTLEESLPMLPMLEQAGVDALDVDVASYEAADYIMPSYYLGDAPLRFAAAAAKKYGVKVPLLNTGNYTPELAVDAVVSGDTDFVMMGRPLLADPDLPNKLRKNKREEIRPCLRCNEYCVKGIGMTTGIKCAVNPQVGSEDRFTIRPAAWRRPGLLRRKAIGSFFTKKARNWAGCLP